MVKINGEEVSIESGLSLEEVIVNQGYTIEKTVVELNGEIIPKTQYKQTNIKDGDALEVISFVGGGWYRYPTLNLDLCGGLPKLHTYLFQRTYEIFAGKF